MIHNTHRESGGGPTQRIDSVDLFRGLTIVAMIWVNDLARVRGIPGWLAHAPQAADAMTFPDVVFPAFLFIVGMAIPIAMQRRTSRGEGLPRTLAHIAARTAGLLIIGVLMVNIGAINPEATGLKRHAWAVLMYLGVILAWNAYPKRKAAVAATPDSAPGSRFAARDALYIGLRLAGVGLLIWLAAIYRGSQGDQLTWLRTQWWGILGLIGWAYLAASLAYLLLRGHPAGIAGMLALGIVLCIGEKNGSLMEFAWARTINAYVSVGGHIGGHAAIVLAGVLAMLLVRGDTPNASSGTPTNPHGRVLVRLLAMAAMLLAAGLLLREPYGLSKVRVTPAWCLYCSAICCAAYAVLYGIVDVRRFARWGGPIRVVGSNALLAFILPGIVYGLLEILGIDWLSRYCGTGGIGIARSFVFTGLMIGLTALLTRLHVRLRL